MNCINHPDRPAVRQCPQCLSYYCAECSESFVNGVCPSCQKQTKNEASSSTVDYYKGRIKKLILHSVICLIVFGGLFIVKEDPKTCLALQIITALLASVCMGGAMSLSARLVDKFLQMLAGDGTIIYSIVVRMIVVVILFVIIAALILPGLIYDIVLFTKYHKAKKAIKVASN